MNSLQIQFSISLWLFSTFSTAFSKPHKSVHIQLVSYSRIVIEMYFLRKAGQLSCDHKARIEFHSNKWCFYLHTHRHDDALFSTICWYYFIPLWNQLFINLSSCALEKKRALSVWMRTGNKIWAYLCLSLKTICGCLLNDFKSTIKLTIDLIRILMLQLIHFCCRFMS